MAGVISTQSYVNPYQWSKQMGGKKGKKKKKTKTKAQKMATARIKAGKTISQVKSANKKSMQDKAKERNKKFKQTKVQTFGGKKTSFTSKEQTRIKDAGYKVDGYSQAKFKPTPKPVYKSRAEGLADNQKRIEASKPTPKVDPIDGTEIAQTRFKSVPAGGPAGDNMSTKFFREGMLPGLRDVVPGESLQNTLKRITNQDKLASADADTTGLGISPSTVNAFKIKSPTTYGAPSQEAVDKAAGITAGGLNIGGGGFTPDKPSGRSTSRAIFTGKNPDTSDIPASSFNFGPTADNNEYARNLNEFGMRFGATPEARADAYDRSLTGRKNLFDDATVGSGPVASGDAYARGLEVSRFGSPMNIGKTILNTIPGVNFRLQNDKELADSVARAPDMNALRRRRGSSGNTRLPVTPLTPEEILLPEETAQTGVDYQQAQTGVDPNRLMQIQQEAYLQAFNPEYNPMFRFFNRRGMGRGSFRKAFRRRD